MLHTRVCILICAFSGVNFDDCSTVESEIRKNKDVAWNLAFIIHKYPLAKIYRSCAIVLNGNAFSLSIYRLNWNRGRWSNGCIVIFFSRLCVQTLQTTGWRDQVHCRYNYPLRRNMHQQASCWSLPKQPYELNKYATHIQRKIKAVSEEILYHSLRV